jgi:uncharacterized protein
MGQTLQLQLADVTENIDAGQDSIPTTIVLSLLPGVVGFIPTAISIPLFQRSGLPPVMAFSLVGVPAMVLYYLLFLLVKTWRKTGTLSILRLILYRNAVPAWQYLVIVPLLIMWTLVITALLSPLDLFLKNTLFAWAPGWLTGVPGGAQYAGAQLAYLVPLYLSLNTLLGPVLEEFYFRGYLLPRISRLGWGAPVLNTVLFYAHHPTLWSLLSGSIAFLPTTFLVSHKKNIWIAVWVHCILNLLSGVVILGFITVPTG